MNPRLLLSVPLPHGPLTINHLIMVGMMRMMMMMIIDDDDDDDNDEDDGDVEDDDHKNLPKHVPPITIASRS